MEDLNVFILILNIFDKEKISYSQWKRLEKIIEDNYRIQNNETSFVLNESSIHNSKSPTLGYKKESEE